MQKVFFKLNSNRAKNSKDTSFKMKTDRDYLHFSSADQIDGKCATASSQNQPDTSDCCNGQFLARKLSTGATNSFFWFIGILMFIFYMSAAATADAATVKLEWDPNPSNQTIDGYHVYMRTAGTDYNYNTPAWEGTTTTCSIDGLENGMVYFFVARAYKDTLESSNSNELRHELPALEPPVANAGDDQVVLAHASVTLDGSSSSDPDGNDLSYKWTQITGPSIVLSDSATENPSFTAPEVSADTVLTFELKVTDNDDLAATDTCKVTVNPVEPVDSDNDGISDADEAIYGTDPNNPDSDGDGITDGEEINAGTDPNVPNTTSKKVKIWIEAEDGDISAPMEITDDPNASAEGYIEVPNGNGKITDPSDQAAGYAEYTFDVPSSGDYVIWGRISAPNTGDNSFFIAVDNGQAIDWHTLITENAAWGWDPVTVRQPSDVPDTSNPLRMYLTAGQHTLQIKHREDGTKIDRILITNDAAFVPTGKGDQVEPVEPSLQKIWIEAEEGNTVAPMQIFNDLNASAEGYIEAPNGTGRITDPSDQSAGYAEYTFDVLSSGDYVIWGRVSAPNTGDNSFFISVDNGQEIAWHTLITENASWSWDPVTIRQPSDAADANNPMLIYLTAGKHTLRIKHREDGTKIDKILITNDTAYVPANLGDETETDVQKIWIEAEDGNLNAPMQSLEDANASGGKYILVPDGNGKISDPIQDAGYAEYTFNVLSSGNYVIWGRVLSDSNSSDSFFVSVDNGDYLTWHTLISDEMTWTWDVISSRNASDIRDASTPLIYSLELGAHTLKIKQREDGTKIDRILITNNLEFVPSN